MLGNTLEGEAVDCPCRRRVLGRWSALAISPLANLLFNCREVGCGSKEWRREPPWLYQSVRWEQLFAELVRITWTSQAVKLRVTDYLKVRSSEFPGKFPAMAYPSLWNNDNSRERRLRVLPDSHCRLREVNGRVPEALQAKADTRWAAATQVHYNLDLQFNSQSLIIAMTPYPTIGGRAWPSIIFDDPAHEFVFSLWCNSTLGLLCHWWMCNKTQAGRGTTTVTSVYWGIPTLQFSDAID